MVQREFLLNERHKHDQLSWFSFMLRNQITFHSLLVVMVVSVFVLSNMCLGLYVNQFQKHAWKNLAWTFEVVPSGMLVIDATRQAPATAAEEPELAATSTTPSQRLAGRPCRTRWPDDNHQVCPSAPCPSRWNQQGHIIFSVSQLWSASCSLIRL